MQCKGSGPRQLPAVPEPALGHKVPCVLVHHYSHQEKCQGWNTNGSQAISVVPPRGTWAVKGKNIVRSLASHCSQSDQTVEDHHIFTLEEEGHKLEVLCDECSSSHVEVFCLFTENNWSEVLWVWFTLSGCGRKKREKHKKLRAFQKRVFQTNTPLWLLVCTTLM